MTKRWEEHKAIIVSFYKEQHKPLHEVKRLMTEQYGFVASLRAYRSRFDRWRVHKYNRRLQWGSLPDGSLGGSPRAVDDPRFGVKTEADHSPFAAGTPPSSPDSDSEQTTPHAGKSGLQSMAVMSPHHHQYLAESSNISPSSSSGGGGGAGGRLLVSPSPASVESTSSGSIVYRSSSISQPLDGDRHGSHHDSRQSRSGMDYGTSPTEQQHQYSPFDVYRQQRYRDAHPYHRSLHRSEPGTGLALPPGIETQRDPGGGRSYAWPAPPRQAPYQDDGVNIEALREGDFQLATR